MKRLATALALLPSLAAAHHPMGGMAPRSLWEGFASGIAHPLLGLDHLAFLLVAGLLLSASRHLGRRILPGFLAAMATGAMLHWAGIGLGPVELVVAASVVGAGALLALLGRAPMIAGAALALPPMALAGLFHGHAFAEAAAGSPLPVFGAYLVALAVMQGVLMMGAGLAARFLASPMPLRAAGLAAVAVGFFGFIAA